MRHLLNQRVFAGILFVLLCSVTTGAQEAHQHHEPGEKIGKVNFVVSCSTESQKQFNRAVAWLHSFEYGESERAFNDIATSDPQCAMFFQDWEKVDHPTRAARYEHAMQKVYTRYPGDREAGVFYALALNATALASSPMDKTYAKQQKAAAILNRMLRVQPEHPGVAHYLIHSYD
jgi:predicted Zn-dependent protease